jgi:5'-3' exonuclease
MGIKAINEFLAKQRCDCFKTIPLLDLHGYRLPIDGYGWVYANMAVVYKGLVIQSVNPVDDPIDRSVLLQLTYMALINFNITLMNSGITPVWVWDGKPRKEKAETRESRKAEKEKLKLEVETLTKALVETPILLRSRDAIGELKKKLMYHNAVMEGDIAMFKSLVSGLGLPSIVALDDAESLCSALAQEGLAIGVWSKDTDNYALGTPLMITGFNRSGSVLCVDVVVVALIRQKLNLTQEMLRDLCIMSGCDFNKNIPNIGPAKSYKHLLKYQSLEAFISNNPTLPTNMYNHITCREILTPRPSGYTHASPEINLDRERLATWSRDVIAQYNLSTVYEQLIAATSCVVPPKIVTYTTGSAQSAVTAPSSLPITINPSGVATSSSLPIAINPSGVATSSSSPITTDSLAATTSSSSPITTNPLVPSAPRPKITLRIRTPTVPLTSTAQLSQSLQQLTLNSAPDAVTTSNLNGTIYSGNSSTLQQVAAPVVDASAQNGIAKYTLNGKIVGVLL